MASKDGGTAKRKQKFDHYLALPEHERYALQMLSVIYHPASRTALVNSLNKADIPSSSTTKKRWTSSLLRKPIESWKELDLIHQSSAGVKCHPLVVELISRDLLKQPARFERYAEIAERYAPTTSSSLNPIEITIRFARVAIYLNRLQQLQEVLLCHGYGVVQLHDVLNLVCFNPFDREWFLSLNADLILIVLGTELSEAALELKPQPELLDVLETIALDPQRPSRMDTAPALLFEHYMLQGRLQDARNALALLDPVMEAHHVYRGWLLYVEGDNEAAIAAYDRCLEILLPDQTKAQRRQTSYFLSGFPGLFYTIALIRDGSIERLQQALGQAQMGATAPDRMLVDCYEMLRLAIAMQLGDLKARAQVLAAQISPYQPATSIDTLVALIVRYWVDREAAAAIALRYLRPIYNDALRAGYDWIALEAITLLSDLHNNETLSKQVEMVRETGELLNVTLLQQALRPKSAWEIQLTALQALKPKSGSQEQSGKKQRMAWAIYVHHGNEVHIEPKEQRQNGNGEWSRGRAVALKRLYKDPSSCGYLTEHDRRVCSCIEAYRDYDRYYGSTSYNIPSSAILQLVGHPAVVWRDSPTVSVEVVSGQPQLVVHHDDDGQLVISLVPRFTSQQELVIEQESIVRLKVYSITERHQNVAAIFDGNAEIRVPTYAQDQVLSAIEAVAGNMVVQSDIGGVSNIESVPADPTPHIHLLPAKQGLKVLLLARPFRSGGPYYRPGQGGTTAITEIEGLQVQTTRELDQELAQARSVISACPTLQTGGDDYEWLLEEPVDCLELLTELQALQPPATPATPEDEESEPPNGAIAPAVCPIVEWPEGEKFKVSNYLSPVDMKLSIGQQRDWFAAEGELRVDETTVLNLQQLLRLLEASPGRFVQLGDGQFAALTKEFRKQLEDLRRYGEAYGSGVRFHPLASLAIEDSLTELGELEADNAWKAHVQKIREMRDINPAVPSTLQAELRDYQIEGYQWLMQLAHWGVGACLADDMGLGKTLQSLAVILMRAADGPTLVVAPTSVGMNWLSEAVKFAPTLNPIWLGSGDRQKTLDALQPRDLVVCSYGLLQQSEVGEMLAAVEWTTVILDEAQAIKNSATQRSKAAMQLNAQFRMILTGTPIENHLGELWNLFNFINPGLLGSQTKFQQRFITPIERYNDPNVRRQLKTLIQPFILRRTKTQVLSELPSRTEITLSVELSAEEMALYEATRRNALTKLAEGAGNEPPGAKHLRVLAEILRLRRLCCNPKLVVPDTPIVSSKLTVFGEVLEELLDNRHKALVFSQFVDHLTIVRNYLDQQSISYQYLDGSTPAKTRKQRVDAFQSGEGDVFLISLKAGGTGLNLTAADYVIHLDPWWNPAVEDQASDRAHRMGQKRPVTIYRLVASGTIEEKIVNLHQQKRDLADSLLEGTDLSGKLSADELLNLISA